MAGAASLAAIFVFIEDGGDSFHAEQLRQYRGHAPIHVDEQRAFGQRFVDEKLGPAHHSPPGHNRLSARRFARGRLQWTCLTVGS